VPCGLSGTVGGVGRPVTSNGCGLIVDEYLIGLSIEAGGPVTDQT
jgi:hypothetical protein